MSKSFATRQGDLPALHAIDLAVPGGSVFGIIGRSGAGKSTLIRLINRLERPSAGRVLVNGEDVAGLDEASLAALRRRTGMIFQHFNLLSAKTVRANVELPLRAAGIAGERAGRRVMEVLDLVGLADKRGAYPSQLSGGQKQRVGIARALVHEPDILLCDEATSALDPETTQSILALLRDINRRLRLTIVLITHEMAVIREICDRVAVLERGELVEEGEVWRVFGSPRHAATAALLRPLVHDLPGELAARLSPSAPDGPHATVFALRFDGAGEDPSIAALTEAVGPSARLLHGGVDRIQDRPQGRLVLSAELEAGSEQAALLKLGRVARSVEIVGYVATIA